MDSKLTDKGITSAIMLGERLNDTDFNAVYSSPNERAFRTATYINENKQVPIYTIEGLKEIHFGDWEGKTKEEIESTEMYNIEYQNFWNNPHMYNHDPHKGESLAAFKQRVEDALKKIISENNNGNVLIVTHAVVIRAILLFTMSISTKKMWDPPFIHRTSLTIFNWDGEKFNYKMRGDTSHFKNEMR